MFIERTLSEEPDANKIMLKQLWHMIGETFSLNPIPGAARPIFEAAANYNFFTQREIVSAFEEGRLPAEQYRYYGSETFREIADATPPWMQDSFGKLTSPLHMENLYRGYTGTMGQYALLGADAIMRNAADYPLPPSWEMQDYPVIGAFYRGEQKLVGTGEFDEDGKEIMKVEGHQRTMYSEGFYELLRKTNQVKQSISSVDKQRRDEREEYLKTTYEPYIRVSKKLENIREKVQRLNRRAMRVHLDEDMTPDEKRVEINEIEQDKNERLKEGYELRPGGRGEVEEAELGDLTFLLEEFGVDDEVELLAEQLEDNAPITAEIVMDIMALPEAQREMLGRMTSGRTARGGTE